MYTASSVVRLLLGLLLWALGAPAWAGTGSIAVTVVDDEMELPVPNAWLVLNGAALAAPQEAQTDPDGLARFVALPPGEYTLTVRKGGFGGLTLEGITVSPDRIIPILVRLEESKDCWAAPLDRRPLDSATSRLAAGLDADLLGRLPVGGTVPMLLQSLPGASGPLGESPRISGGASDQSAYLLDDVIVTDPVTGGLPLNLPQSGLQHAEVIAAGFRPEHTPAGGGVARIVSRYAGACPELDVSVASAPALAWRRVATRLTGPLVRDRLWFVFAHEHVASRDGIDGHSVLARLTLQPNRDHRLDSVVVANPSTGAGQTQGGVLATQRWVWAAGNSVFVDTAAAVQRTRIEAGAATDDRFAANASSTVNVRSVDDPFGGEHDVSVGVQASNAAWSVDEAPRAASDKLGGFVQDAWEPVDHLTFDLGARFDAFALRDGAGEPALSGAAASPRAGVAWDPSREGRTKLAVAYGRAVDTGRLTWVDGAPASTLLDEVVVDLEAEVVRDLALFTAVTARRAEADYTRFDVGARKILSRRWQADATYSFTARQGHTVRGFVAWDAPTDPFTLQATVFALYTDVPALPSDSGVLRVLAPEPYVRTGERGFVGASLLQRLDVREGAIVLRLEASSALDPAVSAPRLLLGAEYAL